MPAECESKCESKQETQIRGELSALGISIDNTKELAHLLTEKLSPILRTKCPEEHVDKDNESESLCELAEEIRARNQEIRNIRKILNDIRDRLEL